VILAILLLLLALLGVLPLPIALPLSAGSLVVGGVGVYLFQRRVSKIPLANGNEAMIGATVPALTNIGREGQIKVGNEIWNARSIQGDIHQGESVRITDFEGLRAIVVPSKSHPSG